MTQMLKLAFVLGVSLLLSPIVQADMGPEVATKRAVKHKASPCAPKHHVRCHQPSVCGLNCCEIWVDKQEIWRSQDLLASGTLHADALYYEYVRTEALCLAIRKREGAVELMKKCPDEAKAWIAEAKHLEYNWRHVEGCDWAPLDPCEEGMRLKHHHHHHQHSHAHHCS